MPTTDTKGIVSGYIGDEDGWGDAMNDNLRTISAQLIEGFANDISTTTGLTYGYKRGTGLTSSGLVQVAAGTITLPPNVTGYVVRDLAGVVTFQTSASFPDKIHLATVTTNVSNITFLQDQRYTQDATQDGTITGRFLTALSNVTAAGNVSAGVLLNGPNLVISRPAAVSGAPQSMAQFNAGSGVGAGENLYIQLGLTPSDSAANRVGRVQVGDNIALRPLHLAASRLFVGTNTVPVFVAGEMAAIEGELALLSGGRNLRLGPGDIEDSCYVELFPRSATPTVRGGFIGFGTAGSSTLNVTNDIGAVLLSSSGVALTVSGDTAQSSGAMTATVFRGSGAELTTGSIPLTSVASLTANLGAITSIGNTAQTTANTAISNAATAQSTANTAQSTANTAVANAATAQSTANGAVSVNGTQNSRLDALESPRAFLSAISDNVPASRVSFGSALGFAGSNTGTFSATSINAPGSANPVYTGDFDALYTAVGVMRLVVQQLVASLVARNYI